MSIKSILCIFGGAPHELGALNAALGLAKSNAAQIRVLHISPDPGAYVAAYGGEASAVSTIMIALEKKNAERLAKARQYVTSFTQQHQIPLDALESLVHHAAARFLSLTGNTQTIVAAEGRLGDLIIVSRGAYATSPPNDPAFIAALFDSGRPVLLMPKAEDDVLPQWRDKTIALAWNASMEAARALWGAMPLLKQAETLHVLTVRHPEDNIDLTGDARLVNYLEAHGLHTEIIAVAHERHGDGELALAQARELKADLLVMGGYGHSKIREMMLGGFTDYMLRQADIPLLMSH